MRFILREVTSNQPHPSSNDTAYYYAEYQPAANTAPLKKGFHSLEWVIVITNPPRYGYKRLTRCTVFQAGADKSHRSLTFSRIQFKPSEEQARSSRKPNYSRKLQTKWGISVITIYAFIPVPDKTTQTARMSKPRNITLYITVRL